jgi:DUF438 domain-containing protein
MNDLKLLTAVLDSVNQPILIADTAHIARYMNKAAVHFYTGGLDLIGKSVLECHNPDSCTKILEGLVEFGRGADEYLYRETENKRAFMVAVRDSEGQLLGYYERFEKKK